MITETTNTVQALKAHISINVREVACSMEFYKKMLGIEPSKVRHGYAKFDVANPPLNLTLNQVGEVNRGALSHLGIQVGSTQDVLAVRERWIGAGLATRDEMKVNCCYAVQDKTWVSDPDGNHWEVFVVLEDNLTETTACCGTDAKERNAETQTSSCATNVATKGATSESQTVATASTCCSGYTPVVSIGGASKACCG